MLTPQQIAQIRQDAGRAPISPSTNTPTQSLADKLGLKPQVEQPKATSTFDKIKSATGSFLKNVGADIVQSPENIANTAIDTFDSVIRKGGGELGEMIGTREEGSTPSYGDIFQERAQNQSNLAGSIQPGYEAQSRDITTVQGAKGLAGDVVSTAVNVLTPELKGATMLGKIGKAGVQGAGLGLAGGLGESLQEDKDLTGTVNTTLTGGALGLGLGGALGALGKGLAKLSPSEKFLKDTVVNNYTKAIKPTVAGKKTTGQVDQYNNNLIEAIQTINKNKQDLNFTDEFGAVVKGKTPETIKEFADAIDQTKKSVFAQYNKLAQEAGGAGIKVETMPINQELSQVANNKALELSNPKTVKYVEEWMNRLQRNPELSPEVVQDVVKNLNQSLEAFYRNPNYDTATQASIDSLIANKFREQLDTKISGLTGEQYGALKKQYGALKSIESDVVKAMQRDARKNIKGLIDFTDILSAGDVINGVLSMNPAQISKGLLQKGVASAYKYLNDPNRVVKGLFETAGKIPQKPLSLSNKSLNNQLQIQATNNVSGTPKSINIIDDTIPQNLDEGKFYDDIIQQQEGRIKEPTVSDDLLNEAKDQTDKRTFEKQLQLEQEEQFIESTQEKLSGIDLNTYRRLRDKGMDFESGSMNLSGIPSNKITRDMVLFNKIAKQLEDLGHEMGGAQGQGIRGSIDLVDDFLERKSNLKVEKSALKDEIKKSKMSGFAQITKDIPKELQPLVEEARKYKKEYPYATGEDFLTSKLKEHSEKTTKPIKVYRGEGKGTGNYTLVTGKYYADSKKFASDFGKVEEFTIPSGSRIIDLDFIKDPKQKLISHESIVDPEALTAFLERKFDYAKNTNARGVEYVKLSSVKPEELASRMASPERWSTINKIKSPLIDLYDNTTSKKGGFAEIARDSDPDKLRIHPDDADVLNDFAKVISGKSKTTPETLTEMRKEVADLIEHYNIPVGKSDKQLAINIEKALYDVYHKFPGFADLGFLPKLALGTAVATGGLKAYTANKNDKKSK